MAMVTQPLAPCPGALQLGAEYFSIRLSMSGPCFVVDQGLKTSLASLVQVKDHLVELVITHRHCGPSM